MDQNNKYFTVFACKSPEGMGLKLQHINNEIVVVEILPKFRTVNMTTKKRKLLDTSTDESSEIDDPLRKILMLGDVILAVNNLDYNGKNYRQILELLRWRGGPSGKKTAEFELDKGRTPVSLGVVEDIAALRILRRSNDVIGDDEDDSIN